MLPWSDPAFPQVIESDFSKNRAGHSAAVNATLQVSVQVAVCFR